MPDALADFEASAYKCTQVRRNPKIEGKTTLAWVALPKGKEPNGASTNEKAFFYGCEAVKVVMLDRWGLWVRKNGINARCCCVLRMGSCTFVLPPEQNQHGARGMGKKSIYYGSVSSLFFRFFVFCPFRFIPFFSRENTHAILPFGLIFFVECGS